MAQDGYDLALDPARKADTILEVMDKPFLLCLSTYLRRNAVFLVKPIAATLNVLFLVRQPRPRPKGLFRRISTYERPSSSLAWPFTFSIWRTHSGFQFRLASSRSCHAVARMGS